VGGQPVAPDSSASGPELLRQGELPAPALRQRQGQPQGMRLRLRLRYRLVPWWVKVVVVFVASRVVTTAIMLGFAAAQAKNPWTGAHPGYFAFANIWDGTWYNIVSVYGYPSQLPLDTTGHVAQNAWAFMPAYPDFVGLLCHLTGVPFAVMAVLVSVAFALGTALVFYRLMVRVLPGGTALFSVVLFCFAPLSPMLQVAYAESMHLFFLTVALYFLAQRRYWAMMPAIAVMSLTRPSGLAFALALGLHVIYRWFVRNRDDFPPPERVASVAVAVFSAGMGLLWPVIAWVVTGSMTAYTDTELAWRAQYIGYVNLLPFTAWIQGANWWVPAPFGPILLAIAVVLFGVVMFTPPVRRLGVDLRFWLASYMVYLFAVFFPQSSTFRLLMPMFPLAGAIAQPRSPAYRTAIVLLFIAGQAGWIYIAWWVNGYDWTPP
jgi:hypothetical protein